MTKKVTDLVSIFVGDFEAMVTPREKKLLMEDGMRWGEMIIEYTEPRKRKSKKARRIDPSMFRRYELPLS